MFMICADNMMKIVRVIAILAVVIRSSAAEEIWPDLSQPISNNAVAQLGVANRTLVFSMLGIGPKRTYDDIRNSAFVLDTNTRRWSMLPAVPGPGRLRPPRKVSADAYTFLVATLWTRRRMNTPCRT